MNVEGKYNNSDVSLVVNKNGNLLVNNYSTKFQELVLSNSVYSVCNQTGITTQAGLSATTPALTLYNPAGSGVNAVILYAGYVNTVAFGAAGVVWLGANTDISASRVTGTATTAQRCNLLGNSKQPAIQPLLAATLPAAPVAVSTLGVALTGAITTTVGSNVIGRQFEGSLIIAPGAAISFQTSTASGTNGFFGEFVWAEVPI